MCFCHIPTNNTYSGRSTSNTLLFSRAEIYGIHMCILATDNTRLYMKYLLQFFSEETLRLMEIVN